MAKSKGYAREYRARRAANGGRRLGAAASPSDVEERASSIDQWATNRLARGSRASTTMIWTPANRDALNLLGRFRNSDYVIRVSDISGNRTRVRIGEDVSVRFIRRSIVDGARRAARGG